MSVNDEGILDFLLAEGANINFQGPTGRTALMWASAHGFEDSVRRLLHGRANITLKDDAGQTALSLARAGGHEATAQLLRDAGATE
jgi:ankyrin repeat protein